jgi:hypothetical protein
MAEQIIMLALVIAIVPLCGIAILHRLAKTKRVKRNVQAFRC